MATYQDYDPAMMYGGYTMRAGVARPGGGLGQALLVGGAWMGSSALAGAFSKQNVLGRMSGVNRHVFDQLAANAKNTSELAFHTGRVFRRMGGVEPPPNSFFFDARPVAGRAASAGAAMPARLALTKAGAPVSLRGTLRATRGAAQKLLAGRLAAGVFTGMNIAFFAPIVYSGIKHLAKSANAFIQQTYEPNFGGHYMDTSGALTERQRAVSAIQKSHLNARAAIGNEASLMHK